MLDIIPSAEQMTALVGASRYVVWEQLRTLIESHYDMDGLWNTGGRAWTYEYKYRRGGKTLCALYARENCIGFLVIFGKAERLAFETGKDTYPEEIQSVYEAAQTYHDGKWLLFTPTDTSPFEDFVRLLRIKRKPNRKSF